MNITIRPGKIEDLKQIQKLSQLLFIKEQKEYDPWYNTDWPFSKEGEKYFIKELTGEKLKLFVAEDNGKIIGFLSTSSKIEKEYKKGLKIAQIDSLMILEEYRSQGIGTKLINEFKKWAESIKAERLIVLASSPNARGIEFYKKQGFDIFYFGLKIDK